MGDDASRPGMGEPPPLSLERLQAILETYGTAPQRWPAAERAAALALLAGSAQARALRDREARLDQALRQLTSPPPSEALVGRLARQPLPRPAATPAVRRPPVRLDRSRLLRWAAQGAAFAAVALVAFVAGLAVPSPLRDGDAVRAPVEAVLTAATAESDAGLALSRLPLVVSWSDAGEGETGDIVTASTELDASSEAEAMAELPLQ